MTFRIVQWLVVCSVIAVMIWLPFFFKGIKLNRTDFPWFLGLALFLGAMSFLGLLTVGEDLVSDIEEGSGIVKIEELVALNDRVAISTKGSFLLASGDIETGETLTYRYVVKESAGSRVRSLDTERYEVYVNAELEAGEKPTLVTRGNQWRNVRKPGVPDLVWWLVSPRTGWRTPKVLETYTYQFNVPADSEVSTIEVDLM